MFFIPEFSKSLKSTKSNLLMSLFVSICNKILSLLTASLFLLTLDYEELYFNLDLFILTTFHFGQMSLIKHFFQKLIQEHYFCLVYIEHVSVCHKTEPVAYHISSSTQNLFVIIFLKIKFTYSWFLNNSVDLILKKN